MAPHQPRVDFQLWFYGLAFRRREPAYVSTLVERMCEDPAAVQPLFRRPLPPHPAAVRIVYWRYVFASRAERRATGVWWRRAAWRSAAPFPARRTAHDRCRARRADGKGLRNASLGTLFLTVFLDLLGFGLVIPFLPGIARRLGAGDFMATMPGAVFSIMQFLFIPIWGRLSDRVGRRPVLLWSIAASAIGMAMLGFAPTLVWLFVARIWSGIATANIAVAQAYIADVTTPERRARGMAIVGISFGLGFIFGPFIGGELSRFHPFGREGMLPPLVAAGLSTVNLLLAFRTLPESLPPEGRGKSLRRASPDRSGRLPCRGLRPRHRRRGGHQLHALSSGSPGWSRPSASSPPTGSTCRTPGPGGCSGWWGS